MFQKPTAYKVLKARQFWSWGCLSPRKSIPRVGDTTGPRSGWYRLGTVVAGGQFLKCKTLWELCFRGIYAHPGESLVQGIVSDLPRGVVAERLMMTRGLSQS